MNWKQVAWDFWRLLPDGTTKLDEPGQVELFYSYFSGKWEAWWVDGEGVNHHQPVADKLAEAKAWAEANVLPLSSQARS